MGIRPSGDGDRERLRSREAGVSGGARWLLERARGRGGGAGFRARDRAGIEELDVELSEDE